MKKQKLPEISSTSFLVRVEMNKKFLTLFYLLNMCIDSRAGVESYTICTNVQLPLCSVLTHP